MVVLLVIIAIAFLILIHEFGHFLAAKLFGLWVEEFGIGFPPRLFSKKIGETVYSVNLLPFGGFVKIHGEERLTASDAVNQARGFAYQSAWKKVVIILAGVFMNFLVGWLIVSSIFMAGAPKSLLINDVLAGSPAALSGIKAGDHIDGFKSSSDFVDFVSRQKGLEITLKIKRGADQLDIKTTPRLNPPAGEGSLGIQFTETGFDKFGFLAAFKEGFKTAAGIVISIFSALGQLFISFFTTGRLTAGFVGPIGIFGFANQAAGLGAAYLLQLIAMISLNLFALNILPFPALDGGRLLFIIIEKIKGSPLSSNFERSANAAGFLVLILLMIAVTVRDIVGLF